MKFKGEIFGSRALRNPVMRGCPRCLAEDAARRPEAPLAAMVMRGEWQMRDAGICLRHESLLVELWSATRTDHRFDIGSRLEEIRSALLSGHFDQPRVVPAPYDIWVDSRLATGADPTWLGGISLYAGTTICGLLGAELLGPDENLAVPPAQRHRRALVEGFDALRDGEEAFGAVLDELVSRATGALDEPAKAFGGLFRKLSRDLVADDAFAPFRDSLRDCILSHWPLAPEEILLGEPVGERRLHSVVTAAREAGIWAKGLDAMLTEAGAFATDDARPHSRKTFVAKDFAFLLDEIPKRVGPGEMKAVMGATKTALASLEQDGVLVPRTRAPKIVARWLVADGLALVEDLAARAVPLTPDRRGWETLQQARKRGGIKVGSIIAAVRSGAVAVATADRSAGYNGFVVRAAEVDALAERLDEKAGETSELAGSISAAAFGRSVGLRDRGLLQALADAGHVQTHLIVHPRTRQSQLRMSDADVAAFHRKFLTLATIEAEFGLHKNRILAMLRADGATPFTADGRTFGAIWLRDAVGALFGKNSGA